MAPPAPLMNMYLDGQPLVVWPEHVLCYLCGQDIHRCHFCDGQTCTSLAGYREGPGAVIRCQWGGNRTAHGLIDGEECPNVWGIQPGVWLPRALMLSAEELSASRDVRDEVIFLLPRSAILGARDQSPVLSALGTAIKANARDFYAA